MYTIIFVIKDNTKIQMGDHCYKLKAATFHHGKSIADGHYTSMVRGKGTTWVSVDDLRLEKPAWPRHATNAYIFFSQRC